MVDRKYAKTRGRSLPFNFVTRYSYPMVGFVEIITPKGKKTKTFSSLGSFFDIFLHNTPFIRILWIPIVQAINSQNSLSVIIKQLSVPYSMQPGRRFPLLYAFPPHTPTLRCFWLAQQGKHISFVGLDSGLVEGVDAQEIPAQGAGLLHEEEEISQSVGG